MDCLMPEVGVDNGNVTRVLWVPACDIYCSCFLDLHVSYSYGLLIVKIRLIITCMHKLCASMCWCFLSEPVVSNYLQGFATMHFTSTALADGSRPVKSVHWVWCYALFLRSNALSLVLLFHIGILLIIFSVFALWFVFVKNTDNSEWEFQKYGH